MITIKTLKTFEQDVWKELIQFSRRHRYIFYLSVILISILLIIDRWVWFEMDLGGCIIYESGIELCTWWFWPIDVLIFFITRIFIIYVIYRIYLQYKHDNL